jgi:dihydropyrimidinase
MFDLRIDNGAIVTPQGTTLGSIGIVGNRIAAVGSLGQVPARQIEDAEGRPVLPGLIDTHVHLGFSDEDTEWSTESTAAVVGGVTTLCVYYRNPADYHGLLPAFIARGRERSHADFIVHLGILNDGHLARLGDYVARYGLRSIKMYTTYKHGELSRFGVMGQDDGFIFKVMREVARIGGVRVCVHCENDDIVERGAREWQDEGSPGTQWSRVRPDIAEGEAVRRIAFFSRRSGAAVFIPHVSSYLALDTIIAERDAGTDIDCETCPQYLIAGRIDRDDYLAKVNPPVRVDQTGERLWSALRTGQVTAIGTDHACWRRSDKAGASVLEARPGFPGVGTLLPILLDGVANGLFSLNQIAERQMAAALTFGLDGKGAIAPGYAADLVVVDMSIQKVVSAPDLRGYSDFSPFEGLPLRGWPVLTVKGGRVVARDGGLTEDSTATGSYLRDSTAG